MIQFKQGLGKYKGDIINCPQCNRLKRQYSDCLCGYTLEQDPNMVEIIQGTYMTKALWEETKAALTRYWSR